MLNTFKSPRIKLHLENRMFNMASRLVNEYNGGSWNLNRRVGGIEYVALPDMDEVTMASTGMQCDVKTDSEVAGAAICIIATNHLGWQLYENMPEADITQKLFEYSENLKYAILDSPKWTDEQKTQLIQIID